ncbi:MAG: hypothetical protein Q3999_08190 [Buchananella hordeovulneris]|nr:hypothetical protein [Buchananella hordeovulneris]
MNQSAWAHQRRKNAALHQRRLQQEQAARTAQARQLIARFLTAAERHCIQPQSLRLTGYNGTSARTNLRGWYLRLDRTVGIDTAGNFYVLTAPLSLLDRFRTQRPVPCDPPLVIGLGGRDGDSIELRAALERLLPGWEDAGNQA